MPEKQEYTTLGMKSWTTLGGASDIILDINVTMPCGPIVSNIMGIIS